MGNGSNTGSIEKNSVVLPPIGKITVLDFYEDTGYPHDGRAHKDSYPHFGRADKDSYRVMPINIIYHMSLVMRKPFFLQMRKQRRRRAVWLPHS